MKGPHALMRAIIRSAIGPSSNHAAGHVQEIFARGRPGSGPGLLQALLEVVDPPLESPLEGMLLGEGERLAAQGHQAARSASSSAIAEATRSGRFIGTNRLECECLVIPTRASLSYPTIGTPQAATSV